MPLNIAKPALPNLAGCRMVVEEVFSGSFRDRVFRLASPARSFCDLLKELNIRCLFVGQNTTKLEKLRSKFDGGRCE